MSESEQIIEDFNSILYDLCLKIGNIVPDSIVGQNINTVEKLFNDKNNKNKFIDFFTLNVLQYKTYIDAEDDKFFLEKDFSEYKNVASKIFDFKSLWLKLSDENKKMLIMHLKILCELSQNYFLLVDK